VNHTQFVSYFDTAATFSLRLNGVGTNLGVGPGEARPEGPRAGRGMKFLGRDSQPLPTS